MLSFEHVGSKHPAVKYCKKLSSPSFRKKEGKLLLEGLHLIQEALKENNTQDMLFLSQDAANNRRYSKLIRSAATKGLTDKCFVVSDRVLKSMAHTENPQGLLAVSPFPVYNLKSCLSTASPLILILDSLQDPGNMGTLIRTAAGAGLNAIISLPGSVDYSNLKVLRGSAGAFFKIPLFYEENVSELFDFLNNNNISLVGTDPHLGQLYSNFDMTGPTALIIGNENKGLSLDVREKVDYNLSIPLQKTESLNAAVAASIIVFEALRQRNFTFK